MVRKKEREEAKHKKKHAGQASIAEERDGSCDVMIASIKDKHSDDWFLDSSCAYLMCPNKS